MSKQLEGNLGRATRATANTAPRVVPMTKTQELEALLQARVPATVVDDIKLLAARNKGGWTVSRILLEALKAYGISVPEDELCDRRK